MDNSQKSVFSREEILANWREHRESISLMSQDELHEVARGAIRLFFRLVTQFQNHELLEKLRADLDATKPEVEYLYLRMTAADRLTGPLNWEEPDEAYRQRAHGIAVGVAARFTGYEVTPEDWPLP